MAAVGDGVGEVAVGDRVSPLYQIHCRECEWCLRGEHYHCERVTMLGVTTAGGYAEYVVAPAWALVPLPDSVSYEDATAIQTTFGTVWHALADRAPVQSGDWVLVNAAGSGVGTAGIQIAKLLGGEGDRVSRGRTSSSSGRRRTGRRPSSTTAPRASPRACGS